MEKVLSEAQTRKQKIYRITIIGSVVNFLLVIFKLLAGIFGRSSAMIADGIHSLSDFVTDIVVVVFVGYSSKPKDEGHNYGHGKFETLATVIVAVVLFGIGVGLFWGALSSIIAAAKGAVLPKPHLIALIAGAVSVVSKEWLFRATRKVGRTVSSSVLEANAWHHRSDAFSSIGTIIGVGGAMFLSEKWRVLDPIAALVVSLFIVKVAIDLIVPAIRELLEIALSPEIQKKIIEIVLEIDPTLDPHNLRTRNVGTNYAIELHVRVDGNMTVKDSHAHVDKIEKRLKEVFGAETNVSLHVEPKK